MHNDSEQPEFHRYGKQAWRLTAGRTESPQECVGDSVILEDPLEALTLTSERAVATTSRVVATETQVPVRNRTQNPEPIISLQSLK